MKIILNKGSEDGDQNEFGISSEADHDIAMKRIEYLMNKESEHVSKIELSEIQDLARAAQTYEQKVFPIASPSTFAGIIEMKTYEMKIKQTELAKKLHVSDAKLSSILSGKQKPDVSFLKAVHAELQIDANILLEAV